MYKVMLVLSIFMFSLFFVVDTFGQNGWHKHNGRWHNHPHNAFHQHFPNQRVVYYPIIRWYPQGTMMNVGPVLVSQDRRYIRMGVNVGFSSITGYHTFNYRTGRSTYHPAKK